MDILRAPVVFAIATVLVAVVAVVAAKRVAD